ncbi:MAG: hypothetical protein MRK01_10620 [Candidatus Scalindua sp.]|nr:hypothetical protein [Candidatus Scalindua sp.]
MITEEIELNNCQKKEIVRNYGAQMSIIKTAGMYYTSARNFHITKRLFNFCYYAPVICSIVFYWNDMLQKGLIGKMYGKLQLMLD